MGAYNANSDIENGDIGGQNAYYWDISWIFKHLAWPDPTAKRTAEIGVSQSVAKGRIKDFRAIQNFLWDLGLVRSDCNPTLCTFGTNVPQNE